MPIRHFHGQTFVAFVDISGFKQMMRVPGQAKNALSHFYQETYGILRRDRARTLKVEGILVSDCAILFVSPGHADPAEALKLLLITVGELNQIMLHHRIMLTASIAYGQFSYDPRHEFDGIEKNLIIGSAYLRAFLDTGALKPPLRCGQCRIVTEGLPTDARTVIERQTTPVFSMTRPQGDNHFTYYWMLKTPRQIDRFEKDYRKAYVTPPPSKFKNIRALLEKRCK